MKYLILLLLTTALSAQAEALLTVDGQVGSTTYTSEGPKEVEATTKAFNVPAGFKMVRVAHADKIVCSAYPQPDTWTMKRIYTPPAKPAGLSAAGSKLLDYLGDAK